jgi:hypothetical protein
MMANVVVQVKISMSAAASTPVYFAMTGAAARGDPAHFRADTFTDIFLLVHADGQWRIANKAYHRH